MLSDRQIIEGLLSRDARLTDTIVKQLYNQNKSNIHKIVFDCKGPLEDAEDLVQDTISKFFENVLQHKFTLGEAQISTYIFSMAQRMYYAKLRKKQTERKHAPNYEGITIVEPDNPHLQLVEREELETSVTLFGRLRESAQRVLEAFYRDGKTMEEIAEEFGLLNAKNAKTIKYRHFKEWRALVKQELD